MRMFIPDKESLAIHKSEHILGFPANVFMCGGYLEEEEKIAFSSGVL
jgi:hypothetical protein